VTRESNNSCRQSSARLAVKAGGSRFERCPRQVGAFPIRPIFAQPALNGLCDVATAHSRVRDRRSGWSF
jgi:hypothetical protein